MKKHLINCVAIGVIYTGVHHEMLKHIAAIKNKNSAKEKYSCSQLNTEFPQAKLL